MLSIHFMQLIFIQNYSVVFFKNTYHKQPKEKITFFLIKKKPQCQKVYISIFCKTCLNIIAATLYRFVFMIIYMYTLYVLY